MPAGPADAGAASDRRRAHERRRQRLERLRHRPSSRRQGRGLARRRRSRSRGRAGVAAKARGDASTATPRRGHQHQHEAEAATAVGRRRRLAAGVGLRGRHRRRARVGPADAELVVLLCHSPAQFTAWLLSDGHCSSSSNSMKRITLFQVWPPSAERPSAISSGFQLSPQVKSRRRRPRPAHAHLRLHGGHREGHAAVVGAAARHVVVPTIRCWPSVETQPAMSTPSPSRVSTGVQLCRRRWSAAACPLDRPGDATVHDLGIHGRDRDEEDLGLALEGEGQRRPGDAAVVGDGRGGARSPWACRRRRRRRVGQLEAGT